MWDSLVCIVGLIFTAGFCVGFIVCILLGILELTRPYKDRYMRLYRDEEE